MSIRQGPVICIAATAALLSLMGVQRLAWPRPAEAEAYHAEVAAAIDDVPFRIGDWLGVEVPQPPEAVRLLKPNRILSRRYRVPGRAASVGLLIVHCQDARDLIGHYPPVCYPAHGWTEVAAEPKIYQAAGRTLPATMYEFRQSLPDRSGSIHIATVLATPDGRLHRDMEALEQAASDYRRHFLGAAQFQVVFTSPLSVEERDRLVRRFLDACEPVFGALAAGESQS